MPPILVLKAYIEEFDLIKFLNYVSNLCVTSLILATPHSFQCFHVVYVYVTMTTVIQLTLVAHTFVFQPTMNIIIQTGHTLNSPPPPRKRCARLHYIFVFKMSNLLYCTRSNNREYIIPLPPIF